ncbi:carcinoembryonic antigen-related cell adhesion molecule 21-like [Sphaeramia orbicularis]|uniref:carcinoembryonic antigen-related cell adhesion molecule 21-like n=1 Tax=Sphaeramia orbicularis TaxID=375764 RepID=UPI0011815515|nr:carcinoembryonic antigen-related cell adhesion molecule 21-like [Sphaeramia orbicularis]
MNKAVIYIILGLIPGLTKAAGVLPDVLNTAVGDTVIFETSLDPTQTPFQTIIWNFDELPVPIFISTTNKTAPGYEDRLTVFMSTGSLELRNVSLFDTGRYNVNILIQDGNVMPGSTMLNVYERVSAVSVTSSSSVLVELNSSVHLSCSSSGSFLSFRWFNGSSEVTASDRVQITDGGSSMTIVTMTLYDEGPFRCHVSNAISNDSSDPLVIVSGIQYHILKSSYQLGHQ